MTVTHTHTHTYMYMQQRGCNIVNTFKQQVSATNISVSSKGG